MPADLRAADGRRYDAGGRQSLRVCSAGRVRVQVLLETQWSCEGDAVVCKAKFGAGDLETVGDKVCETRGAPKPASTAELRIASTCEPVTEMRGSAPTAQCLAQWGTPEPTEEAPTQAAATTATDAPTSATVAGADAIVLDASFATTLAVAALALYA